MVDGLNLEQLGTAGLFVVFLLYVLNLAWKKIDKNETKIDELHDRNNDNLVTTIKALHAGDEAQVKQLEAIKQARNDV